MYQRVARRTTTALALLVALGLTAAACTSTDDRSSNGGAAGTNDGAGEGVSEAGPPPEIPDLVPGVATDFGPAPSTPDGPTDPELVALIDELGSSFSIGLGALTLGFTPEQLDRIVEIGDPRALWLFSDLLRFPLEGRVAAPQIIDAFEELSGTDLGLTMPWTVATNSLIAWDLDAPDNYLSFKRSLFSILDPRWEPLFDDDADVDWRHVSWGGVLIDDRALGDPEPCERGCIPALDDPVTTDADGGSWYPDDRVVFGVVVNGEARAYPKNIMEVHEMVNDTVGGRRLAIPYCTLCGSAQAYLTDELASGTIENDQFPVMRTSGLLIRSNKMMYELNTTSLVDTFIGEATSGPLAAGGVTFDQVSVVASTWAEWKQAHPDTTIVAEDGGIGRSYPLDPLRGRDDDGPIFPIGSVDPRLPVQEPVLGIITDDGQPVAIHVAIARATLLNGEPVTIDGIEIELDGDGIRAVDSNRSTDSDSSDSDSSESDSPDSDSPDSDSPDIGGHQAFWFAWSQFHPTTLVWPTDF